MIFTPDPCKKCKKKHTIVSQVSYSDLTHCHSMRNNILSLKRWFFPPLSDEAKIFFSLFPLSQSNQSPSLPFDRSSFKRGAFFSPSHDHFSMTLIHHIKPSTIAKGFGKIHQFWIFFRLGFLIVSIGTGSPWLRVKNLIQIINVGLFNLRMVHLIFYKDHRDKILVCTVRQTLKKG